MTSFLRFAALSGGGWLLDCGILLVLTNLAVPLGIANFLSSVTAAVTVFLVSRYLVFSSARHSVFTRVVLYVGYQLVAIFVASLLIGPAADIARWLASAAGLDIGGQVANFAGKILITPPQLVANFLVSRFLIQHYSHSKIHG